MAQLLKGNRQPLAELYAAQGDYLANVLKNLNICQAAEENITTLPTGQKRSASCWMATRY